MLQQVWAKINSHERLAVIGAALIVASYLLGLVLSHGFVSVAGTGSLGLLGAIAVIVVVYLKNAPDSKITWPAPYATILLAISAVVAVLAALQLLQFIGIIGLLAEYGGISVLLVLGLNWVGAAVMVWGAYQEYQAKAPAA